MKLFEDIDLTAPVTQVLEQNVAILDDSACINEAAKEMQRKGVSSVLVRNSKSGELVGIVTRKGYYLSCSCQESWDVQGQYRKNYEYSTHYC